MKGYFFAFIIYLVDLAYSQTQNYRFVFSIFRHGARAPQGGVVNGIDMLGEQWNSPGELTEVGMRMHFLLGTRNRAKYGSFLGNSYDTNLIYVRSSDFNRTMMSVQSQLQGWFPPGTGPSLTSNQLSLGYPFLGRNFGTFDVNTLGAGSLPNQMQVFPVHLMVELEFKYFFFYTSLFKQCPPLEGYFHENTKVEPIKSFIPTVATKYGTQLKAAINATTEKLSDYHYLFGLFDTFIGGLYNGKTFSKLTAQGLDINAFNQTAFEFATYDIINYYNGGSDYLLARFTTSAFLDELFYWMENRMNYDIAGNSAYYGYISPKVVLFSTHDVTLGSLLVYFKNTLGTQTYYTPFASALFIELTLPSGVTPKTFSDFNVSINFNDNILLTNLPYDQLKSKLMTQYWGLDKIYSYCTGLPLFLVDWVGPSWKRGTIGMTVIAGVFFFAFITVLIICCCCYERKGEHAQVAATTENNKA